MTRQVWGLVLAAGMAGLAGCGGGTADLAGTVTYKGKPVTSGTVQALQAGGKVTAAGIGADGRYRIADAAAGAAKVGVNSPDPRQAPAEGGGRVMPGAPKPKAAAADPTWVKLPDKYADPDTSGLTTTLSAGSNTFDIKVVD